MANRAEQKLGPRIAELPDHRRPLTETPGPPVPSVPAALEKLASATQRVISKRIDLVALESHEMLSSLITKAGLVIFGAVVGVAAWISGIAGLVMWLAPGRGTPMHLAIFAGVNAAVAAIVVAFALREKLPTTAGEIEVERTDERAGEHAQRA